MRRVPLLGVAQVVAGSVVASRLLAAARPRPPIGADAHLDSPADATADLRRGTISIVIPARNEADRIGPCLDALRDAPGVVEVIVVDDESTDGTAALAASHGARVVKGAVLPDGWAGKCWALQQGIEAAVGDWIVTLDADTIPDPRLPGALVARVRSDGWHFLTVAGRFRLPTAPLRWLHPSLLTSLVYRYGPPGKQRAGRRPLANGQCMTFRRRDIVDARALHAVRGSLIEDVALARSLHGIGWNVGFLDASALLTVAMHTSARDAWRGWGRSLPLGDVASRREQAAGLATVGLTTALPIMRLVSGRATRVDLALLALRFGTLAGTRRAYEQTGAPYWLSPLADPFTTARLLQATVRPERTWRGRSYAPLGQTAGR